MGKFNNERIITDFRNDQNGSPSYRWKALQIIEDYDIWLKYYGGGLIDNDVYSCKSIAPQSLPHAYIYYRYGTNDYISYEYKGDVIVNRETKDNIRLDVIQNIDDIIEDIKHLLK